MQSREEKAMSRGPVRRAQLIAPFGVGAITVAPDGTAILGAGLDHWYEREGEGRTDTVDVEEFEIEEWRLQAALRVTHFRLPPDYRVITYGEAGVKNLRLTVPFLRFPTWNFCPRCKRLVHLPLSFKGRQRCEYCEVELFGTRKKAPFVAQVPFIAICEYGHLQDFPWCEWVHRELHPSCSKPMKLRATGGASLAAQSVECECGKKRNLARITEASPLGAPEGPTTFLSSNLTPDDTEYLCRGVKPWHGSEEPTSCGRPLRGSLRAASNVYYALQRSSIYLPRATGEIREKLMEIMTNPPLSTVVHTLHDLGQEPTVDMLRQGRHGNLLGPYPDDEVSRAVDALHVPGEQDLPPEDEDDLGPDETEFRRPEFEVLRSLQDAEELRTTAFSLGDYSPPIAELFGRIVLVEQLRETRALWGFNRIFPESEDGLRDRRAMMWRSAPDWRHSWLPAYVVHGEGIFLELNDQALQAWEQHPWVQGRIDRLAYLYERARHARRLRHRVLSPRFVLVHTLAHVIINQLTYECGYSSAALRERLYVSTGTRPMAAALIYTAAGDSEGTMGGLVRMAKPGYLEPTLLAAIESARWCSADPVCMEIGEAGQGPDSCNLAACHNCALIPETACEEFNRFLDRALLVGPHPEPSVGFFKPEPEAARTF
jgi:hypothetical protein